MQSFSIFPYSRYISKLLEVRKIKITAHNEAIEMLTIMKDSENVSKVIEEIAAVTEQVAASAVHLQTVTKSTH